MIGERSEKVRRGRVGCCRNLSTSRPKLYSLRKEFSPSAQHPLIEDPDACYSIARHLRGAPSDASMKGCVKFSSVDLPQIPQMDTTNHMQMTSPSASPVNGSGGGHERTSVQRDLDIIVGWESWLLTASPMSSSFHNMSSRRRKPGLPFWSA